MGRLEVGQALGLNDIVDFLYPVGGNPYVQFPDTPTPAEIFPNTSWEIDTDYAGRTLVGSGDGYEFGAIGGSADAVVVAHAHIIAIGLEASALGEYAYGASLERAGSISQGVISTGESGIGKNMPPYKVVNVWKRIA